MDHAKCRPHMRIEKRNKKRGVFSFPSFRVWGIVSLPNEFKWILSDLEFPPPLSFLAPLIFHTSFCGKFRPLLLLTVGGGPGDT